MTYRETDKARSPALEKLAAEAANTAPAQTSLLAPAELARRLELAADVAKDTLGCLPIVTLFVCLGAAFGVILGANAQPRTGEKVLIGLLVVAAIAFIIGTIYMSDAATRRRMQGVDALLGWERAQPFPVTGFRDWLVNDRSVLVIHLRAAIAKATVLDAARVVDPAIEALALDDKTFQLVLPSRVVTGEYATRYGDVKLLKIVFDKLVLPLHGDVGIERVTMGGTIHERV